MIEAAINEAEKRGRWSVESGERDNDLGALVLDLVAEVRALRAVIRRIRAVLPVESEP